MSRQGIYAVASVLFALTVAVGGAISSASGVHPLYLILLFTLCLSPLLYLRRLNDRYALLAVFSVVYFMFFGLVDFIKLMSAETSQASSARGGLLSMTELVILTGGAMAHLGYHIACGWRSRAASESRDWPEHTLVLAGGVLWIVCTALAWDFKVNILTDATIEATKRGLAGISGLRAAALVLAVMIQPLGILVLAYAQCVYRRAYMMPLLIGVVAVQVAFGFIVDIKGDALIGAVLVVLTKILVEGKLPKTWLVAFIAFTLVAFPVLQANRYVRGHYGVDRTQAAQHIGQVLRRAFAASEEVKAGSIQAAKFHERLSLKGSVELIVSRTGRDVAFQNGYTLTPLLTTFIPRLIWPTKPDVQTGQIMNREFQVSEVEDTYISPSHLGELYWNFGWPGVVGGMVAIGALLGLLGARFNLADASTLTRLMVIVITIRFLILSSEGTIAVQYVVWLRSMLAIGLLHIALASSTVAARDHKRGRIAEAARVSDASAIRPHPNLMT